MPTSELLSQIAAQARAAHPRECCGVLVAAPAQILAARAIANLAIGPGRFEFDPLQLAAAERAAAIRGWSIIGYYHSHAAGPPTPSRADVAGLLWPGLGPKYHLIIAATGDWALYRIAAPHWIRVTDFHHALNAPAARLPCTSSDCVAARTRPR